jgi:hypothetical protein
MYPNKVSEFFNVNIQLIIFVFFNKNYEKDLNALYF